MPAFDFSGYSTKSYSSPSNKGNTNREKARSTNYNSQPKINIKNSPFTITSTFKDSKKKAKDAVGKSNLDNAKVAKVPIGVPGSTILNPLQDARQKLLERNTKFFREKVLTSKNRSGYVDTLESYESYMKNRLSGKTDAYGNVNPGYGLDKGNNIQTQKVTAGGQTILTKEKTPAETKVAEEKKEYDARQTKKKGKRKNILTSSQGIIKLASDYSLSDKNLLGRVV